MDEAELLMRTIEQAPADATILEIGSFQGRSTLFGLAAAGPGQLWISVDSFRTAAAHAGHSYRGLVEHVGDSRHLVLPMTLGQAYPHLRMYRIDVAFIDGDHSYLGVTQDLALAIDLGHVGTALLCHDVCDLFPGVVSAVGSLVSSGVLRSCEQVGSLLATEIASRPRWLTRPEADRGDLLPERHRSPTALASG